MEFMNVSNFCSWWPVQSLLMKIGCLSYGSVLIFHDYEKREIPESILDFLIATEHHSSGVGD